MTPPMTGPVLVLVGPPAVGKSSVAAVLARRHGLSVHETDEAVAAAAGQPVAEIFVDHGEQRFRELEVEAVTEALATQDGIVCLGSGAVQSPRVRELLAGHRVVLLDVGIADAARRSGLDGVRPFQLGNVRGRLKQLLDERRPLYTAVADATVATDGLSVDEVADAVWTTVEPGDDSR